MKSLIVAKFREDISWLNNISGYKIYLYDKLVDLPNIGREAHTYVHHIITNYSDLSDINVFTQANPFFHSKDFFGKDCQN
jgi:hypothetical protein